MFHYDTVALYPTPARHTALVGDWRSVVMAHHTHIVGQSGVGKTTLIKTRVISAIKDNHAVCYIDPHGADTDELLHHIPDARRTGTVLFDPTQFPISLNPLTQKNIPLIAQSFVDTIRVTSGYTDIATPRIDVLLYNTVSALMEAKEGLFGIYLMLVSPSYQTHVLHKVRNPVVMSFWQWYRTLSDKKREEFTESTYTKIQMLFADPRITAIAGTENKLDLYDLVQNKILFIRLPQGELGLGKTSLIGNLLIAQLHQALLARDPSIPFHLFIDEVHNFAPAPLMEMLSGIRKYNVHITVAHQYMAQLDKSLLASLKANATSLVFRTSFEDTAYFPQLSGVQVQPHELFPFHYLDFGKAKVAQGFVPKIEAVPYEASYREVLAHNRRNISSDATREVKKMLEKYG